MAGRDNVVALARALAPIAAEKAASETVKVRRHPQDWQTAQYRLSDVQRLHLDTISGGVGRATAHATVFGYVLCDQMLSGELAHSCSHGPPPHLIIIALPKTLNKPAWKAIQARLHT